MLCGIVNKTNLNYRLKHVVHFSSNNSHYDSISWNVIDLNGKLDTF